MTCTIIQYGFLFKDGTVKVWDLRESNPATKFKGNKTFMLHM